MSGGLSDLACDIGFRVRSARAVVRQIDEVLPMPQPGQLDAHNEAGYLLAAVVDLLDMVANSSELLEVELKTQEGLRRAA